MKIGLIYEQVLIEEMNQERLSSQEVYNYINKLHKNGWERKKFEDPEWVKSHDYFILKDINLDDPTIKWVNRPAIYSKEITDFPPIVISNTGYIIDGVHRSSSARARGDKTIKAYVGVGERDYHKEIISNLKKF